ncbi:MAG TPA: YraN family protein [Polyangiaceae bacterium]|nr:YraN family protein [Polyangiaceae bacterium]
MDGQAGRSAERHRLGRRAELAVADYLVARGFSVLARNLRLGRLELDVVARRGGLIVVVEVRTRGPGSFERAFESVSRTKRARLARAVERLWRERLARMPSVDRVRIDVAAVTFEEQRTLVEYIEGALS